MRILFALFIIIPILEMWLLISVGQWLGVLPTIGLVLLTAVIGVNLLRAQGLATLTRAQERLASGAVPAQELVEGMALAVGGALLLTPGFATDAFGFACLIPQSRKWLASILVRYVTVGSIRTPGSSTHGPGGHSEDTGPVVIDGEYEPVDEDSTKLDR